MKILKTKIRLNYFVNTLPKQYIFAAIVVISVSAICFSLGTYLEYQTVRLLLLFTVIQLALFVNFGPVVFSSVLSAAIWDYFFQPPLYTIAIRKVEELVIVAVYISVGIVAGYLTLNVRRQKEIALGKEQRTTFLNYLANDLALSTSKESVADSAIRNIEKSFKASSVFFVPNGETKLTILTKSSGISQVDENHLSAALWSYENNEPTGKYTNLYSYCDGQYFPVSTPRGTLGVLGIYLESGDELEPESVALMNNFVTQISSAFEREISNDEIKKINILTESEKLYKTILNLVSHELKTPISIITGASSIILDADTAHNPYAVMNLSSKIYSASMLLNRLVANLLDMSRLESGYITLKLDWCDINELFNVVVNQLKGDLKENNVFIESDLNLPLVKMDFVLMSHALSNIVQNAAIYNPPGTDIRISAEIIEDELLISVKDNGTGIPENFKPLIFDKFYRIPGTKKHGTGLGLSISKGFIEAHGGTITVENVTDGGSKFLISLNINESMDISKE